MESRTAAGLAISAGLVRVGGAIAEKASRLVAAHESLAIDGPASRFVGRGGEKLQAALDEWPEVLAAVAGRRAIDCGSSTGGFTDCLLQHGARLVVAVDVGRGQLHQRLLADDRVTSKERTDIRLIDPDVFGGPFDILVADLSFISLTTVAESLLRQCVDGAPMILLVKPQFEVGREGVCRQGSHFQRHG